MLVLTRKNGEKIVIGGDIEITVVEIRGNHVRLGIEAPKEVSVLRETRCGDGGGGVSRGGLFRSPAKHDAHASPPGFRYDQQENEGWLSWREVPPYSSRVMPSLWNWGEVPEHPGLGEASGRLDCPKPENGSRK